MRLGKDLRLSTLELTAPWLYQDRLLERDEGIPQSRVESGSVVGSVDEVRAKG